MIRTAAGAAAVATWIVLVVAAAGGLTAGCSGGTQAGNPGTGGDATGGTSGGAAGTDGTGMTAGTTGAAATTGMAGAAGTTGVAGMGGRAGTSGAGEILSCPFETNPPTNLADSCEACLTANENPATDGCCQFTDELGEGLCQEASACMRSAGCNAGGDVTGCFCGADSTTCRDPGHVLGPCAAAMTAAAARNVATMTTDDPTVDDVLLRFGDPRYAVGRAVNIQVIAGTFCPTECGF